MENDVVKYALDEGLVAELRNVVRDTHLYQYDSKVKSEYSMICAVADRIQDADRWIDDHLDFPNDCVTAQTFLMLLSVVKSGVEALCKHLNVSRRFSDSGRQEAYKFFGDICRGCSLLDGSDVAFTDDEFFQYFRALAFSHPYGTFKVKNNYPFLEKDEVEYSPYIVLEKDPWPSYVKGRPSIGVHVYSNMRDDTRYIFVPYESLLGYLKSRHDSIRNVVDVLAKRVSEAEARFRQQRIECQGSAKESLRSFVAVLKVRGRESDTLDEAIRYLDCPISKEENRGAIEVFRNEILRIVPQLSEELHNLNYEDFERRLGYIVDCAWHKINSPIRYHIGKVFEYFDGRGNEKREWGRLDLKILNEDFVRRWVNVSYDMPDLEICLLVTVAFYMEYGRYMKLVLEKDEPALQSNVPRMQLHLGVDKEGLPTLEWVEEKLEQQESK